MLEDPWAECTPVPVSEVAKKVQVSTRHRYRLFQRLDQTEDNDGLLDDEEPGKLKCQLLGSRCLKYFVRLLQYFIILYDSYTPLYSGKIKIELFFVI